MSMDMFDKQADEQQFQNAPLATRMRPKSLEDFVGQEHILGKGRVLRRAIETDRIPSIILWGPPGSGKTTLANIIANSTGAHFSPVSAVSASVTDLRKIVAEAKERRHGQSQRTILFIDEIHRFNRTQQDAVLPFVEDGTVILIGATTENPSFEVTSPLLSRTRVLPLKPLTEEELDILISRASMDKLKGLGELNVELPDESMEQLIKMSNSDARMALNTLEIAALSTPADEETGKRIIKLETIEDAFQKRAVQYDRAGDQHYNLISALHKSLRDSDVDASIYWLAMMLEAGEDPLYIARRMVRFASEDVGMADPQALVVAMAAQQAVHFIGMPEGNLALTEAAVYLATAPKSNSLYTAYSQVQDAIKKGASENVPYNIRNAPTPLMKDLGYGKDYKYAHDFPGHVVDQQHLPDHMKGRKFYTPGALGFEKTVQERMDDLEAKKRKMGEGGKGAES
ncbi:MAG: replication-associated recombination protein A [Dehalococcoidales bacterium]|nr:replication-associated recombination protein A [Dehalococcoidales bacterium]